MKYNRRRFGPEAMARYEADGEFVARQLTDTAYMARIAMRYPKALEGVEHMVANPGRLTALARGKWHLNGILSDDNLKTRKVHRHHAVDAAVVALTDRAVLTYHVVPGKIMSGDIAGNTTMVETVQGSKLSVDATDGVKIDEANVVTADIVADNGVIHVIDAVVLPN